jgi:hypothetical protein
MEGKSYFYARFLKNLLQGLINNPLDPGTAIHCALLTESYIPDRFSDDNWEDLSTYEVSGGGYLSGGKPLENLSITREGGVTTLKSNNLAWGGLTVNTRYAVIYDNTPPLDNEKKLILYLDFTELIEIDNGTLNINWESGSVFSLLVV